MKTKTPKTSQVGGGVFIEEQDPDQIVQWEDVRDTDSLLKYYMQRMGPDFRQIPLTILKREHFLELVNGEDGKDLYSQMWGEDPEAASEAFLAYSPRNPEKVLLSFHLEGGQPGNKFTTFVAQRAQSNFHKDLVDCLARTARLCQKLRGLWKKQGGRIHKIRTASDYADRTGLEIAEDV